MLDEDVDPSRTETDTLVVVAFRSDQNDIARRVHAVLALAPMADSAPCVYGEQVDRLTANDYERLVHFMGREGVEAFNIGSVTGEHSP